MEVSVKITFKPREKKAYSYRLICATEREKFVVPLLAQGTTPCLDFPDSVEFRSTPCKSVGTETFMVRNLGDSPASFTMSIGRPFTASVKDKFVAVGSATQVTVTFCPEDARDYHSELIVEYTGSPPLHIEVVGRGASVDVGMLEHAIALESTYISLSSHKVLKLFNRSNVPAKFAFKGWGTLHEEQQERDRLKRELRKMESSEIAEIMARKYASDDGDLSDDDDDMPAEQRADISSVKRRYKNLRKHADSDSLFFADENFKIEPISGEIWPNSEADVTIVFNPNTARDYSSQAFLDITGMGGRDVLDLFGTGIGPKAMFAYDVLDIGDVFVNSKHRYELTLKNKGDIPATYILQDPKTPFGPKFSFMPRQGVLEVGATHVIEVDFCSDILGEFSEQFSFALAGSGESLSVHFKGHVVGPTFHFDVETLNFGMVSYEFLHSKSFCLYNTSEIPMRFGLRVPQDGKFVDKEFQILPPKGEVLPGAKQNIRLDFISTTVKKYEYFLTVDVDGVGKGLCSIPITAECGVPDVKLVTTELQYETCFIRYPYTQQLQLENNSDLQARYEILPQDKHTKAFAEYDIDEWKGVLDARQTKSIDIRLTCERLGKVKLPIYVRIAGSEKPPLVPIVQANAIGPIVSTDQQSVDWGKTTCLLPSMRKVTIKNESLIKAPFQVLGHIFAFLFCICKFPKPLP